MFDHIIGKSNGNTLVDSGIALFLNDTKPLTEVEQPPSTSSSSAAADSAGRALSNLNSGLAAFSIELETLATELANEVETRSETPLVRRTKSSRTLETEGVVTSPADVKVKSRLKGEGVSTEVSGGNANPGSDKPPEDDKRACTNCSLTGARFSCTCQTVWYCGPECQKAHWSKHKKSHKRYLKALANQA